MLVCLITGCASGKGRAQSPPAPVMPASTVNPTPGQEPATPPVYFRGMFKKQTIPWAEDLTLANGLLQAEFQGLWNPTEIVIIRKGQTYRINANRMLRGQENPLLEPNDIVEIRR